MAARRARTRDSAQLDIVAFRSETGDEVAPDVTDEARLIAAAMPPGVRLGTSSWTFPGWGGIVYAGSPSQAALVRAGLKAYAAHPLLRTVGIDRSHYAPLTRDELARYAAQLPPDFRAVSKVWDEITTLVFPAHPRFGARAGQTNPGFLDPARTLGEVIGPYADSFAAHAGPFVFEITPMPRGGLPDPTTFSRALARLFARLPTQFRYAVELRNRELLTARYLDTLRAFGVAHVLNFWTAMPTVGEQLALPGVLTAPFVVSRLMLPPYTKYEDKRAEYAPFNRIVAPQISMRADIVELVRVCDEIGLRDVYIVVNNKAEGSSPLTVFELARALRGAAPRPL